MMFMQFEDLKEKVVLVTGASRGLGKAMAVEFSRHGAQVAANYNASSEKAQQLKEDNPGIEIFKADVSDRKQVRWMVNSIIKSMGRIDVIVNNAGVWKLQAFEEFDEVAFEMMWRINLLGAIYTTLEVLPYMKKNGGSIINIASNAGIGTAANGTTLYAITKASLIMLTKRLAFELGSYNIRVNAIAPGWTKTDLTVGGRSSDEIKELESYFRSRSELRAIGSPEDIARLAVYLGSDYSRFMTGQVLVIDGGRIDNLSHSI
ncbi:MAG: SDR family oxidoreductase [Conexivisphaerales archaeon]